MTAVFEALRTAAAAGESVRLGVVTRVRGSSPQKTGALAVFHADGRITGTLGGGCLEAEVQQRARALPDNSPPAAFDLVLDRDFGWDDGMICGGRVEGWMLSGAERAGTGFWQALRDAAVALPWGVTADGAFVQGEDARRTADALLHSATVLPPVSLWIAGAGHIAQAVAPLAARLGFAVTVFDDRADLAGQDWFPESVRTVAAPWPELLATPVPPGRVFGLIVTRGHEHDALTLRAWLGHGFAFLGMIGSRRKARLIRENFVREGLATEAAMAAVECPVGLSIGAVSPEEIAVSIAARLVECRAASAIAAAAGPLQDAAAP